jgi:hypothetical protein
MSVGGAADACLFLTYGRRRSSFGDDARNLPKHELQGSWRGSMANTRHKANEVDHALKLRVTRRCTFTERIDGGAAIGQGTRPSVVIVHVVAPPALTEEVRLTSIALEPATVWQSANPNRIHQPHPPNTTESSSPLNSRTRAQPACRASPPCHCDSCKSYRRRLTEPPRDAAFLAPSASPDPQLPNHLSPPTARA